MKNLENHVALSAEQSRTDRSSTTAHTPGPWSWMIEDVSMAYLHGPDEMVDHVLTSSPCKSCQEGNVEWEWGRCMTPTLANARLIAAAPDMLAAAQKLSRLSDEIFVKVSDEEAARMADAWRDMDAAIAKATGAT